MISLVSSFVVVVLRMAFVYAPVVTTTAYPPLPLPPSVSGNQRVPWLPLSFHTNSGRSKSPHQTDYMVPDGGALPLSASPLHTRLQGPQTISSGSGTDIPLSPAKLRSDPVPSPPAPPTHHPPELTSTNKQVIHKPW